jgi:hypothetical protein
MQSPPYTVVSFFTPNWEYPQHALNLIGMCNVLNTPHYIKERPTTGNWRKNCRYKPSVIREALGATNGPVLWLDVDNKLIDQPKVDLTKDIMLVNDRYIQAYIIFFNNTPAALNFLDKWDELLLSWPSNGDHTVLQKLIANGGLDGMNVGFFPKEYTLKSDAKIAPVVWGKSSESAKKHES